MRPSPKERELEGMGVALLYGVNPERKEFAPRGANSFLYEFTERRGQIVELLLPVSILNTVY